ncbi:transglycosylase SLT domain-containing protein [Rhodovulum sp. YNF3179]|uniref:transglycosylase SLT domain-containing protein n=1 Tax=Rhodovulum sp. YNF3179 TaxID=3425127 RepID=UPI003D34BDB6
MRLSYRSAVALVAVLLAAGCAEPVASTKSPDTPPPMRWDHRPEADRWTAATMAALDGHGRALVALEPADVGDWCPAYPEADAETRKAFWAGLISTLAKHESTWNPGAAGGGGRWFGLVQIAPATARGYGCAAGDAAALKDGAKNLSCAVRIMAETVPRDGVIAAGGRGVAADWGPFHSARKRGDMRAWTRAQSYCRDG